MAKTGLQGPTLPVTLVGPDFLTEGLPAGLAAWVCGKSSAKLASSSLSRGGRRGVLGVLREGVGLLPCVDRQGAKGTSHPHTLTPRDLEVLEGGNLAANSLKAPPGRSLSEVSVSSLPGTSWTRRAC